MPEEIFRFSLVRNPRAVPPGRAADTILRLLPDGPGDAHPATRALTKMRGSATRAEMVVAAERLARAPKFIVSLDDLQTPIGSLVEQLGERRLLTGDAVRALAKDVFGMDATAIATAARFRRDLATIEDAIVLLSVVPPATPGLRSQLLQARRTAELILRLAAAPEAAMSAARVRRILSATVLLPSGLFPLPDNSRKRQEENRKEYDEQKKRLEEERKRAQGVLDEVARNTAAINEISEALGDHLLEVRTRGKEVEPLPKTVSTLPKTKVTRLSKPTRDILDKGLGLSLEAIDAAFVTDRLEKKNTALNQNLVPHFADIILDANAFYFSLCCGECGSVTIPPPRTENNFVPDTRGRVELLATQELLMVRQELLEYRAGEIAHIENVLDGEKKGKRHRKLHRTETTIFEEREREEEVEEELQTTDKYELQTETSRVIGEEKSADAGVTMTAKYGPVEIEAHGNYAQSSNLEESRNTALSFARDVVSRSLQRIRERVLTRRSRTDLTEVEIVNRHSIENPAGSGHVRGVYRWVNKYYRAQVVNYGKRTMLEFMVPEPAAFYKFAHAAKRLGTGVTPPERPGFCRNGTFHPLRPNDLQPENYMCFVGKYNVKDVQAPAPLYLKLSDLVKYKIDNTGGKPVVFAEANDSFKIPDGYVAKAISYVISGGNSHSATTKFDHDDILLAVVTIGDKKVYRFYKSEIGKTDDDDDGWPDLTQVIEWGNELSDIEKDFKSYAIGEIAGSFAVDPANADLGDNPSAIKVSITGHTTLPLSLSVHYSVLCERTAARFQQWQIDTFNAIHDAYQALKQEYESSQQGDELAPFLNIQGRNPLLNREIEKRELKKFAISILTGQQFESFNAMEPDYQTQIPQLNLIDAAEEGSFVRFFEQALEWKHMTYMLYPYFWGNKRGWADTVTIKDSDPIFEQFLQAGFARVWVPVRPNFELAISHYVKFGGEPWNEQDAPLGGDGPAESIPAVAMIDELKEQLGNEFEPRPGTVALTSGDTQIIGTGTDFSDEDVDREILINLKTYRIASVDEESQSVDLREAYEGPDLAAASFAVGVKFVGEPWMVEVPTSLVFLDDGTDLIVR